MCVIYSSNVLSCTAGGSKRSPLKSTMSLREWRRPIAACLCRSHTPCWQRLLTAWSTTRRSSKSSAPTPPAIAHPMLAASPDGVVDNETLVEVKCPYTSRDRPITHVTVPYSKLVDGCLNLDTSHNYYYQIQGQLYCTGRMVCDLVVYSVHR